MENINTNDIMVTKKERIPMYCWEESYEEFDDTVCRIDTDGPQACYGCKNETKCYFL